MADKKISELNSLYAAAAQDLIPLVDVDQDETKKIRKDLLMGTPGPIGNLNPSTGQFTTLQLTSGATVDEISTDVTFAAAADDQLATALAIKTYVDNSIGSHDEHNELLGIQGGDSTAEEYYHLTLTEHDQLTGGGITSLHYHSGSTTDHNTLNNLQGGDSTSLEYYHLTQAIHDGLFSGSPLIGLGSQSGTNLIVDYGTNEVTIDISSVETLKADSTGLTLQLGTNINEFSTDGTLSGNSDDAVPTEKAVKTYVDNIQALDTLSGMQGVVSGDSTCTVVFDTPQVDTQYSVVGNLVNEDDTPPSIYAHIITEKTVTGFSVLFSGPVDSGNYVFDWIVSRNSLESSSSSSSSSSTSSSSSSSSSAVPLLGINDNEDFLEINDGGDGLLLS